MASYSRIRFKAASSVVSFCWMTRNNRSPSVRYRKPLPPPSISSRLRADSSSAASDTVLVRCREIIEMQFGPVELDQLNRGSVLAGSQHDREAIAQGHQRFLVGLQRIGQDQDPSKLFHHTARLGVIGDGGVDAPDGRDQQGLHDGVSEGAPV